MRKLVKTYIAGSCLQVFDSVGLGWGPIMYISNKLSDHGDAAGPGTTL